MATILFFMQIETYEQAVAFWNSRINYEKIGMPQDIGALKLDRIRLLLKLLGNPHESYRIVHVTGTKGKGSTATMIASVLQAAGYRTGLYTSPHLVHVEERAQVKGHPIDRHAITICMNQVAQACFEVERLGEMPPTFFEIITAVGMLHFAQQKVDFAVLEVGMGGQFDATNVVDPLVSVITSISLDHVEHLGATLERIAFEKAGIIKENRPVVSGVREDSPAQVIHQAAESRHSKVYRLGVDFDHHWQSGDMTTTTMPQVQWFHGKQHSPWYPLGMWGRHQADNAALAIQTVHLLREQYIKISEEALAEGLSSAVIPGRLEVIQQSPWLVVDAAHNERSIQVLLESLATVPAEKRHVLFAVSKDKQIREMLQQLLHQCDSILFTRYSSSSRGADPNHLLEIWHTLGGHGGKVIEPARLAWQALIQQASTNDLICATGSVFLVGEIRQLYRKNE
ncbi:MAG TPA: folylpolyglutamate synthase/dihydrofolate synthase family protein [Gemmatales bacterium]|nr:folylpolyglutamate synthase/dihydrofolate synthase family protein [Gemmatales bacterium]